MNVCVRNIMLRLFWVKFQAQSSRDVWGEFLKSVGWVFHLLRAMYQQCILVCNQAIVCSKDPLRAIFGIVCSVQSGIPLCAICTRQFASSIIVCNPTRVILCTVCNQAFRHAISDFLNGNARCCVKSTFIFWIWMISGVKSKHSYSIKMLFFCFCH